MDNVSLVIPCYNHWRTTAECLATIFNSGLTDYKVIVVDDVSTDATPKLLQTVISQGYPVQVITNKENKGYIGSTNVALKIVDTDFIALMNNDVHLDKMCIKNLIETYKKHSDVGVLGAAQFDKHWKPLAQLKFFKRGEEAMMIDHMVVTNIPEELQNAEIIYCDDVHFACALISKEVLNKVGLLDEDMKGGNYDQESYCCAVKEAGWRIAVCPTAKYIHYCSVSVADQWGYYCQMLNVNRQIFFKKWGQKLKESKI